MTGIPGARADILALRGYKAGAQVDDTIRLNANEAPVPRVADLALNRYPEVRPVTLQNKLSELFGMPVENLLVTRGSSEAIDVLIRAWCRAYSDSLITTPPTFEMYRVYANIQGVEMIDVPLDAADNFALDADAVIARCETSTKLVFICTPNNPMGTLVPTEDILKIARGLRGKCVVVVDEAYIEFADRASIAPAVLEHDNLVVLRTLSKAHALAGARCGAAIACEEIIDVMARVLPPYSFPTPVIDSVMQALSAERIAQSETSLADVVAERERVAARLPELESIVDTWPSQ